MCRHSGIPVHRGLVPLFFLRPCNGAFSLSVSFSPLFFRGFPDRALAQPDSQPLALTATSDLAAWTCWVLFLIQAPLDSPILVLDSLTQELGSRPIPDSALEYSNIGRRQGTSAVRGSPVSSRKRRFSQRGTNLVRLSSLLGGFVLFLGSSYSSIGGHNPTSWLSQLPFQRP